MLHIVLLAASSFSFPPFRAIFYNNSLSSAFFPICFKQETILISKFVSMSYFEDKAAAPVLPPTIFSLGFVHSIFTTAVITYAICILTA